MSDIGRGSYLIVINDRGCFDYNKKTMILNQIDSVGLSTNWYDKQDSDLMVKFRDDTNLIAMDLGDSDIEKLLAALLKYKSEQGEWDNVCQECLKKNSRVRRLLSDAIMNESHNSGIEVNELCEEKYYSAKEILNDYELKDMANRTIINEYDSSRNVLLSTQELSILNTHENNIDENYRRGNDMGTSMVFFDDNDTHNSGMTNSQLAYSNALQEQELREQESQERSRLLEQKHNEEINKEINSNAKKIKVESVRNITIL